MASFYFQNIFENVFGGMSFFESRGSSIMLHEGSHLASSTASMNQENP
jgi:hypothetical protein